MIGRPVVDFGVLPNRYLMEELARHDSEEVMKYVLLAYADEQQWDAMSSSERDALANACAANDEALRKSGRLLAVEGLQSSRTATTVRVRHGALCVTDGPYAQTKEQLIGLFTVNARDLNEAIQVAATMPQARGGPIEVRPVLELA
jgi:hypothetical protein